MDDLLELEETGFCVNVHGEEETIWGTLLLVPGDNLASHYLGGYKSPSGALRKCRYCIATYDDMSSKFLAEEFQARTQETHSRHCFAISSTSDEVRKANTTTFGICRDSILNTSKYYHVTEGLCPDVMHDMLEGCAQYEVKELLGVLINYLLAPVLSLDSVAHLRMIINHHHIGFSEFYPSCRITPKMHYIIHYPEWIAKWDPLVRFWCMRSEGKLNYFKEIAHRVKCFQNIPKTFSHHHQRLQCYYLNSSSSCFEKPIMCGPCTNICFSTLSYQDQLKEKMSSLKVNSRYSVIHVKMLKHVDI